MKRVSIFLFAITSAFMAFSQTLIEDGDRCFNAGAYACAIANYEQAVKVSTGIDKQIAEIRLQRAKWCADQIKVADMEFAAKNFFIANQEYKKVLETNPKDSYVQTQIAKCEVALNPPKLRKATTAELTDVWNNKYGIRAQRRQNLINAGIDPADALRRINAGEGKPPEKEKLATTLTVSRSTLHFISNGETSGQIRVNTDASTFSVPLGYLPSWCTVRTYSGYFTVTASANPNYTNRKDWFVVTAGGKEVRINVEQAGRPRSTTQQSTTATSEPKRRSEKKCFNCPNTDYKWGLTLGFTQQSVLGHSMEGIQFGLKFEPLFKYGFGLNTGINIIGFSRNLFDTQLFDNGFDAYTINIPLHLEYRLNFSKWFNIFAYGGLGFNFLNPNFGHYSFPTTMDYGGGIRINRLQFNAGQRWYLVNLRNPQDIGQHIDLYQKLFVSVSLMF